MIDPVDSLVISIQNNPGVYALLLGSGVSRAAGIPTGWEITLDLISKLGRISGQSVEPDPESWFREKYRAYPEYSRLLNELVSTPTERQQLLLPYFEPSSQERENGTKQPTAAHRAIAKLVSQGFIRVIITTNFDRLIEKALEDVGVTPTILSSREQVQSMIPLIHIECCLFKIHGDYLDTRLLNTPNELKEYPVEYNVFLDQIFRDFGLIVCGWSAAWDAALREAMFRASSHRFTTYWTVMEGEFPSDEAQKLIAHRDAKQVEIKGADSFFSKVQNGIKALQGISQSPPTEDQLQEETDWNKHAYASALVTANLLGAWDEGNAADREVIRELADEDFDPWIRKIQEIVQHSASPVTLSNGLWKVSDRESLWQALGTGVFNRHLCVLRRCAVAVLSERDPQFELPPPDRNVAQIRGKVLRHSSVLRKGLAQSLALLGTQSPVLVNCSQHKPENTAILAIREIFANADWVLWGAWIDCFQFWQKQRLTNFWERLSRLCDRVLAPSTNSSHKRAPVSLMEFTMPVCSGHWNHSPGTRNSSFECVLTSAS